MGLRYIKKVLTGLATQLDSRVFKAHAYVPKTPDARAIIGLQDVRTDYIFNVCKTCGQTATVQRLPWLQFNACPVDHSQDTTTVSDDPTI
jgi:hypothetical protein